MYKSTKHFKQSIEERQHRIFGHTFKLMKVREIVQGKTSVSEVCRAYELSQTSVYPWIHINGLRVDLAYDWDLAYDELSSVQQILNAHSYSEFVKDLCR